MNILFSKNSFAGPISGADEIVVSYAVELKSAGHSPGVLLVHAPRRNDPLVTRLNSAGVPVSSLASPAFTSSLAACRKLAIQAMRTFTPASRLIRSNSRRVVFDLLQRYHDDCCEYLQQNRPDLMHVMTPDPGAVMLIRAAHAVGVPVVYQEVGIPFHPPGFEEVYERFVSVLPLCDDVAVLSPRLSPEMGKLLAQERTPQVVPLISHDTVDGFSDLNRTKSVRFGFAARLEYLKGALPLIEGFSVAHSFNPDVELKVAGNGSLRQQMETSLRKFGLEKKCEFIGVYLTVEERYRFMRSIDVFVLPSLTEGTPNVIIEAMAQSKPIIATTVGGIPDIVTQDLGILVPPNDSEALGEAMTRLANHPELRKAMGEAARRKYEQLFTPTAVLPVLLKFYSRVMGLPMSNNGDQPHEEAHPWVS